MTDDFSEIDELDLGTSLFELIEFSVVRRLPDGEKMRGTYGVNVAKVREVLSLPKINPLASTIDLVAGIFELRGTPIPAINLARALGDKEAPVTPDQQIIVTEFSQKRAGFIVSSTHRIRRVSWDKVLPPSADSNVSITGMTLIEDNEFLFILDFEKILGEIERLATGGFTSSYQVDAPRAMAQATAPAAATTAGPVSPASEETPSNGRTILLVDDSELIINMVGKALQSAGYTIVVAHNGAEALAKISDLSQLHAVVTDVEMPRMDGLTLTQRIRDTERLQDIPVILHSSLSGKASQEQGIKAGANGYVVKNNIRDLLAMLTEVIGHDSLTLGA